MFKNNEDKSYNAGSPMFCTLTLDDLEGCYALL